MGCGSCGHGGARTQTIALGGRIYEAGPNSVYELQAYPGDFSPYQGKYRTEAVFIVDLKGPNEMLFKRADRNAMLAYAKSFDPPLGHAIVPATQIPRRAAEALYG